MSFYLNHDNLLDYLKNKLNFEPVLQQETEQIYVLLKIKGLDVPVFFGIRKESSLLQLIAYLPYQIHEKTLGEVARMLHLLNKQLDMPGFGMDEKEKLMFFRSVIPCLEDKVNEKLLGMHIGTLRLACDTFMHAIGMVASGTKKVDDL